MNARRPVRIAAATMAVGLIVAGLAATAALQPPHAMAPAADPTGQPLSQASQDPSPEPTPGEVTPSAPPSTPAPSPAPAPTVPAGPFTPVIGELEPEGAARLAQAAVTVPAADRIDDRDGLLDAFADIAAGAYLEELEAQWLELHVNGWTSSGAPKVAEVDIVAIDEGASPARAEVAACVDSGDILILDADGEPVGTRDDTKARARHLLTLERAGNGPWLVVSRTFADDPVC